MATRSVVLDTETTGMPVTDGHRIIEIGCVELMGRRLTGRHFFRNLFGSKDVVTVQYPEEHRPVSVRWRGRAMRWKPSSCGGCHAKSPLSIFKYS